MVLDIILALILALAAFKGWRAGALSMLLSIVILVVAGVLSSSLADAAGNMLKVGPTFARPVIGFAFVFAVLTLAGSFLKRLIKPKEGVLRGLDGLFGAVLGLIRGAFMLSIMLVLLKLVHLPPESTTSRSILYPTVLKTSAAVIGVLKPYVHDRPAISAFV